MSWKSWWRPLLLPSTLEQQWRRRRNAKREAVSEKIVVSKERRWEARDDDEKMATSKERRLDRRDSEQEDDSVSE